MGMLTFGPGAELSADPLLVVPNRVIRELQWEYLAFALKDTENIWIETADLSKALSSMAIQGDIEPLLTQFREQVVGARDVLFRPWPRQAMSGRLSPTQARATPQTTPVKGKKASIAKGRAAPAKGKALPAKGKALPAKGNKTVSVKGKKAAPARSRPRRGGS